MFRENCLVTDTCFTASSKNLIEFNKKVKAVVNTTVMGIIYPLDNFLIDISS